MRQFGLGAALAALLLASACGGGDDAAKGEAAKGGEAQSASASGVPSSDAGRDGPAAVESVEAESQAIYFDPALEQPNCNAPVNAGRYPEPEIVGVRLGMTPAEAVAVAHCTRRSFHVETTQTMMSIGSKKIPAGGLLISMNNAELRELGWQARQNIEILAPGPAGQERVQGVWRSEQFRDAANSPTVTATMSSLTEQFGEPTELLDRQQGVWMSWVYSPSGERLEGRDARRCAPYVMSGYNGVSGAAEDCGLTVKAQIRRTGSYTDVTAGYTVGMANQQALFRARRAMREQILAREADAAGAPDL